jgi:hypothetical protein
MDSIFGDASTNSVEGEYGFRERVSNGAQKGEFSISNILIKQGL